MHLHVRDRCAKFIRAYIAHTNQCSREKDNVLQPPVNKKKNYGATIIITCHSRTAGISNNGVELRLSLANLLLYFYYLNLPIVVPLLEN